MLLEAARGVAMSWRRALFLPLTSQSVPQRGSA